MTPHFFYKNKGLTEILTKLVSPQTIGLTYIPSDFYKKCILHIDYNKLFEMPTRLTEYTEMSQVQPIKPDKILIDTETKKIESIFDSEVNYYCVIIDQAIGKLAKLMTAPDIDEFTEVLKSKKKFSELYKNKNKIPSEVFKKYDNKLNEFEFLLNKMYPFFYED